MFDNNNDRSDAFNSEKETENNYDAQRTRRPRIQSYERHSFNPNFDENNHRVNRSNFNSDYNRYDNDNYGNSYNSDYNSY
ncbi:MAG: hypothetical protein Q4D14_04060, partial [Bacteroidales bacterium]|nr:hypothetical protein [Bacteroidales bacterium]